MINKYIENNKILVNTLLFPTFNKNGQKLTKFLQKLFKKYLDKSISVTLLRHIVSSSRKNPDNIIEDSVKMSHNPLTHIGIYDKS